MIETNTTRRNESLLQALTAQHNAITNNIANADTPNYKKKTVEFQEELRRIVENGKTDQLAMKRTHNKHFPVSDPNSPIVQYRIVENNETTMNNNNNNVDIDKEMADLSENQLMYNYMVDRVSGHYKKMKNLLNDLK
ncbi:flagellar basal body rod protein FlgB [Paenibacillus sp. ClWae2A]|uniref:flagellar basal body rod protein FlgB n=1 Tax=Paenibacillus sp. ClWae2A TaxID=3057177 RepID=UPI0028F5D3F4|nr:flagellar basal body rod protein FlgB [Paenibacillus sp. ClWae2A]MDT9721145.1 flagellar basal body rod protein FlgB [Paenibacillus sp. ClWae2A]